MQLSIHSNEGKAGKITVSDKLFAAKANKDLVYQVATAQMSNMRAILAHTKTRSEVRGGGKKPWRQKGTGRARHGSIRSPIWVGGGVAHGPSKDVNFKKKINRAQSRAALASVLSSRVTDGSFLVTDAISVPSGKTKEGVALLKSLTSGFKNYKAGARVLVVLTGTDDIATRRATDNIPWAQTIRASDLNTLTVLSFPYVIASRDAVEVMEKTFSKPIA